VVSGLARGIDTAAHQGALDAGGRTVAILGSGLDRIYPPENRTLAEAVCDRGGAVVSEFSLGMSPFPHHFPRRNRLIAGWGRAVVVVEAAARSGALGTARAALEEGREVLAVPGHPSRSGSAGTNQLIRDGAVLVRDAADVALELGLPFSAALGDVGEDEVLKQLSRDAPASLDEIQTRSGRPIAEVLARLGQLEISAKVRRLAGSLYVRA
jgi:DNA processing protein